MNKFNKKILYSLIIFAISLGALAFFVAIPSAKSIKEHKRIIGEREISLQEQESKVSSLKTLAKDTERLNVMHATTLQLIPNEKGVSMFIVALEQLANEENLQFKNVAVSEPKDSGKKEKGAVKEIHFSFDVSCAYSQLMQIIGKLEGFSRLNSLTQISLSMTDNDGLSVKIGGIIYYEN